MFAVATKNFVEEVDYGGFLIPVSSLNDTIGNLTVVVKQKRFWFWQKPKYHPTDFNLSDLLTGDQPIKPVVMESDFIKYSGTFGDHIKGGVDASFASSNISLQGNDSSKLQSSFGSLKKEEVDVQKLLKDCKGRVLDMSHCLIQQTKEKRKQLFGIVKECIVTTQPCSVIEEVQQGGQCGGSLGPFGLRIHKVSLKETASLNQDSNVTMEIPTHTTLAYGLLELEVKQDGTFTLCLMSGTKGGFDTDGPVKHLVGVSGAVHDNNLLRQDLEQLQDNFQLLSALPASIRSALLQRITELMQDSAGISALQDVLENMCLDKKPGLDDGAFSKSQQQNIKAVLDLLEQAGAVEPTQRSGSASVLAALHLITSALEQMTSGSLAVLRSCSNPTALQTLELLVECVSGTGEVTLSRAALTEDMYKKTEHLFASSNVSLTKDTDVLRAEIIHQPGNHPLVLCIAIRGLALLASGSQ
ncbi:gasdermin Eb [Cololabis saira]|uniref:gasdermin Eb n=1 Tax=Cololabis saira TaxID=129043 RepID=UPI002AD3B24C|nr:gasdermin Eb [Cololabis saira]